jgi:hypothetical protein
MSPVVIVEFRRPTYDQDGVVVGSRVVTRVRAEGNQLDAEGEETDFDRHQRVLSLRDGQPVRADEDAEEWLRGLTVSYRTPNLWVEIVEDTDPPPPPRIAPAQVREPILN